MVEERMESLLTALDLAGEDGKLVVDYSAGMTKKILLACALLHAPRLLVLDEPLEAVDPVSAQVIRKILTAYVDGGGTVVLSSHVMELVEGLCSHVAIIARGELLADGTLDQVRQGGSWCRPSSTSSAAATSQREPGMAGVLSSEHVRTASAQASSREISAKALLRMQLRLKWTLWKRSYRKNVGKLIGTIIGALYGLGGLVSLVFLFLGPRCGRRGETFRWSCGGWAR